MNLDDLREVLYLYTKELSNYIEEGGTSLEDDDEAEAIVEEFILSNNDLLGELVEGLSEESY